jgi:hypothetical protein
MATNGVVHAELHCSEPLFAAGEVRSGIPLMHRFSFVNRGPEPVEVTGVRPGCGCLKPQLECRTYRPGEEGSVRVEVNTVTQAEGPNAWRAVLQYRSAGVLHELPLSITAHVLREVSIQPANAILYINAGQRQEFTLADRRSTPLAVVRCETTSAHVRASAGEARRDPGGHWTRTLVVEVLPDCPEGRHEEMLHIHTSDATYPHLMVPFTVVKHLRQQVSALPAEVSWSVAGNAPVPARLVLLGRPDEQEVVVDRVEADSPAIQCRWAPGPGTRATVKVQVERSQVPAGGLQGNVRVHLSKPAGQTVTIPVRCSVR